MNEQEARQEAVASIIAHIEENYQNLLDRNNIKHPNAASFHIYLTDMIDSAYGMPDDDPIMKSAIILELYMMRSAISVEAEFLKIAYEL